MPTAYFAVASHTPSDTATGVTLTVPSSIPDGSVGLLLLSNNSSSDTLSSLTNGVGTWTAVDNGSPGTSLCTRIYRKDMGAADSVTTLTASWSGAGKRTAGLIVISGGMFDVISAVNLDNTVDTLAAFQPVTPTVADCMIVAVASGQHPTSADMVSITGLPNVWTERLDAPGTAALPITSAVLATTQLTGGAGTPVTAPTGTWATSSRDVTWLVSIKPRVHDLVPAGASHAHAADNVTLTQVHELAVAGSAHAHTADAPTIAVTHHLTVADTAHPHTAADVTLTQVHELEAADTSHPHTADEPTLTQVYALTIADAIHPHTADNAAVTPEGPVPPERTAGVPPESRTIRVPAESRVAAA